MLDLNTHPDSHRIFVFGSNMKGLHGLGAALHALQHYGAQMNLGYGFKGNSYAIPTKGYDMKSLRLDVIKRHVDHFIRDVLLIHANHPEYIGREFNVTQIGCGYAGYTPKEIAPLFTELASDEDSPVFFDIAWKPYLPSTARFWKAPI